MKEFLRLRLMIKGALIESNIIPILCFYYDCPLYCRYRLGSATVSNTRNKYKIQHGETLKTHTYDFV